jgi:DNA invertase Pin-like site-specific DNA recombinase
MSTKAVAYLRVSGKGQLDGDGYDRQREAIAKYAEANDIELIAEFEDGGISGKTELEDRAGLAACLERIENNGVKLVLVESADRLARDAMVSELIVRQFQKVGGVIITASGVNLTEGDDSNPTSALIRGVLALIAEFDRRVVVLKLRAARQRLKHKNGKCEGAKAYGHNDQENHALRCMRALRLAGQTYQQIAIQLNSQQIPTRFGGKWGAATVAKILTRDSRASDIGRNLSTNCATTTQGDNVNP